MKKKSVSLFAVLMLMLVLTACGPRLNDHVTDYHIDLPDGFVETELEGANAAWYNPADNSNINLLITTKAATADVAFKAVTADALRETVEETLKNSYGTDVTITERFFTKENVCGLPAYQYSYVVAFGGQSATQVIVSINADKTYTFTYTTSDSAILKEFEQSARNIQLTIE